MSENASLTTAFVSIHDVAPAVLDEVSDILDLFRTQNADFRAELLVIPGLDWDESSISQLRSWSDQGHKLVGHGWIHRCVRPRTLWHRIHSLCLSRDVAEHLSRSSDELRNLVLRCFNWFEQQQLPTPSLYVPPAWALGSLGWPQMAELPFRFFENLNGYIDARNRRFHRVPLVGYEADTTFRSIALRTFNRANLMMTRFGQKPLRISIHPHDLKYKLAHQIELVAADRQFDFRIASDWLCASSQPNGSPAENGSN